MPTPKGRSFSDKLKSVHGVDAYFDVKTLVKYGVYFIGTVYAIFLMRNLFSYVDVEKQESESMTHHQYDSSSNTATTASNPSFKKEHQNQNRFSLERASQMIMVAEKNAEQMIHNAEKVIQDEAQYLGQKVREYSDSVGASAANGSNGFSNYIGGGSRSVRGKNLVIGMAKDLEPLQLVVFVGSLRKYCDSTSTDVVIFLNEPIDPQVQEIMEKYEVVYIPFTEGSLQPPQLRDFHPSTIRWPLIYEYIRQSSAQNIRWDTILMADVRDTAFQMDPFATIIYQQPPSKKVLYDSDKITYFDYHSKRLQTPIPGFYTFNGVENKNIAECGWNGGWVKSCFGPQMLKQIGSKNIICSGISIGTYDEVVSYITSMTKIILGDLDDVNPTTFQACERNGVDQGVHNVLVHTQQVPKLMIKSQRQGLVCNLQARVADIKPFSIEGSSSSGSVYRQGQGSSTGLEVRSPQGHLYAIVHQYDRNAELTKYYFSTFQYWDADQASKRECANYQLHAEVDLFKGRCDSGLMGGVPNEGSCCKACSKNEKCKGFTFLDGKCFFKDCHNMPADLSLNRWKKKGAISAIQI